MTMNTYRRGYCEIVSPFFTKSITNYIHFIMTKEQFDSLCVLDNDVEELRNIITLEEKEFPSYSKEDISITKYKLFELLSDAFHIIFESFKVFLSKPNKSNFSVYISTKILLQDILNSFCKISSIEFTEEEKIDFPSIIVFDKETIPSFIEDMIVIFKSTGLLVILSFLKEREYEDVNESTDIHTVDYLINFYHLLFNFNELERMIYPLIDFDSIKNDDDKITKFESDKTKP